METPWAFLTYPNNCRPTIRQCLFAKIYCAQIRGIFFTGTRDLRHAIVAWVEALNSFLWNIISLRTNKRLEEWTRRFHCTLFLTPSSPHGWRQRWMILCAWAGVRFSYQCPSTIDNDLKKVVLTASSASQRSTPDRLPDGRSAYVRNSNAGLLC